MPVAMAVGMAVEMAEAMVAVAAAARETTIARVRARLPCVRAMPSV